MHPLQKPGANHDRAIGIDGRCRVLSNTARVSADHSFFAHAPLDCDALADESADEADDKPVTQNNTIAQGLAPLVPQKQPEIVLSQRIRVHLQTQTRPLRASRPPSTRDEFAQRKVRRPLRS